MKKNKMLLVLWVTGRCNLQCIYCYASAGSELSQCQDMPVKTAMAAITRFADAPLIIQFTGGEPLLGWETICEVVRNVEEQGIDAEFRLQTNGTLLERKHAEFIKEHAISIGISLDGVPEVNELLRGKTADAIRGVRLLAEYGIRVNINAVVTAMNVRELPRLVDFCWYLGSVNGIGLDLFRSAGRGRSAFSKLRIAPSQIEEALPAMQNRCDQLRTLSGRSIALREVEEARRRMTFGKKLPYCYAGCGRAAALLPDGSCYPCGSLAGERDYFMGNILEHVSLKKLDGETKLEKLRKKECLLCQYKRFCPEGCPSRMILNGEPEVDCSLRKTAFQIVENSDV